MSLEHARKVSIEEEKIRVMKRIEEEMHNESDEEEKERVLKCIEEGVDVDIVNDCGETALVYAANQGYVKTVKALLDVGADVHFDNESALFCAILNDDVEMMKLLVEHGATLERPNLEGITFLHIAAEHNCIKAVKYLVEQGADIRACTNIDPRETPLGTAIRRHHNEIADFLQDLCSKSFKGHSIE